MNKFPNLQCHEMVVMPNHFHCIIEIVGANLCVRPNQTNQTGRTQRIIGQTQQTGRTEQIGQTTEIIGRTTEIIGRTHRFAPTMSSNTLNEDTNSHLHNDLINVSISTIIQWFKTMTTNAYIRGVKHHHWQSFNGKLWQRNYYEHIIRNESSYQTIAHYIINNPAQWDNDTLYQ
jgi:REP element-mobilizing transposase RayT